MKTNALTELLARWALLALACWADTPYAAEIVTNATGTNTIVAAPASGWLRGRFMWEVRAPASAILTSELYVGSREVIGSQVNSNAWFYTAQPLGVSPGPLNNVALVRNNDLTRLYDARSSNTMMPGYSAGFFPQEFILAPGECARWVTTTASPAQLSVRFQGTQTT